MLKMDRLTKHPFLSYFWKCTRDILLQVLHSVTMPYELKAFDCFVKLVTCKLVNFSSTHKNIPLPQCKPLTAGNGVVLFTCFDIFFFFFSFCKCCKSIVYLICTTVSLCFYYSGAIWAYFAIYVISTWLWVPLMTHFSQCTIKFIPIPTPDN